MKKITFISILIICNVFISVNLFAKIIVESATGEVAFKTDEAGKWQPLKAKAELQDGVKISTGLNSKATLNLNGSTVVIGPLSMMKVYENQLVNGTQQTKIGMKRGEMTADVTKGEKIKTVFKVATPVATSSVRGTQKEIKTGPSGTTVKVLEGSVKVDSKNGQSRVLSGRLAYNLPKGAVEPKAIHTNSVSTLTDYGNIEKEQTATESFGADSGVSVIESLPLDSMNMGNVHVIIE
jgi:hypothetical protein